MEARPRGIDDDHVSASLADSWGFAASDVAYAPIGFGSYHWVVRDERGDRRFVTVDDLDAAGTSRADAFAALECSLSTARALRDAGLAFVVAPVPAIDGSTIRHLTARHTVAVFPYVEGRVGRWGDVLSDGDRAALVELLARLHGSTTHVRSLAPRRDFEPIAHSLDVVAEAMRETADPWTRGPYGEPARQWLRARVDDVCSLMDDTRRLAEQVARSPDGLVVTHGEPHPGNVIRTPDGLVLIDWDTVGLAPPERDLWRADKNALHRYAELTGRPADRRAIALYRNAWTLADVAVFTRQFRSPHAENEDTTHAWHVLEDLRWDTGPACS